MHLHIQIQIQIYMWSLWSLKILNLLQTICYAILHTRSFVYNVMYMDYCM